MTSTNDRQTKLFDRFKLHSGLPDDHVELFRDVIIATQHYIQHLDDGDTSDEEGVDIGVTYLKDDGSEFTLADVPVRSLVNSIEEHIQVYVPEHRRTEVYKMVVEGIRGIKQTPRWDRQADNPRAMPQTPFSESRAPLESRKTNESLFRTFASASKLDRETLACIRGMIVWRDSERNNGTWGAIEWDTFEVTGGRLGPTEQHTLADIPHCYVRDRLMASTTIDISPERRDQVQEVVFSDLTSSQVKQYAAAIEEMERQAEGHRPAKAKKPRRSREVSPEVVDRALSVYWIQQSRKIAPQEAECIMKEEELLDAIDDTINLAPNQSFTALKLKVPKPEFAFSIGSTCHSVLTPSAWVQKDDEVSVPEECEVDRDCDQIRAMIKILIRGGHWKTDEFIRALEGIRHRQLINFLEKRGPLQGKKSLAFRRSWEFFKKRELLGFELTAAPPKPPKLRREVQELVKLREVDPNRGHKRQSQGLFERPKKLQKASKY
ncbi:hypothetical protein F4782DRAFT_546762 [Xylaria castorea]|nr:hypothetical protein F4782DRAFT_546762 [Xylaria castorea]